MRFDRIAGRNNWWRPAWSATTAGLTDRSIFPGCRITSRLQHKIEIAIIRPGLTTIHICRCIRIRNDLRNVSDLDRLRRIGLFVVGNDRAMGMPEQAGRHHARNGTTSRRGCRRVPVSICRYRLGNAASRHDRADVSAAGNAAHDGTDRAAYLVLQFLHDAVEQVRGQALQYIAQSTRSVEGID